MADFIWGALAGLFITILDWVAYTLLSYSYTIFLVVSKINLFATEGGMAIFETVTKQIYTIVGVAMVFVFAYQLVLLIINPEGGNQKSPSKLFFDSVVSMISVLVLPTIFNYMTIFQEHVLENGTIPAILLGTNASTDIGETAGNKISMMVFMSFFHPDNSDYTTFYNEKGQLKGFTYDGATAEGDAVGDCKGNGDKDTVCQAYYDALKSFETDHKISSLTNQEALKKAIYKDDKGMTYMWILSTVCAVVVAWFFVTYSIDIGTRAVKLGFLQIIAPAPVILRIFPQTRKTFETWFGELTKTYVEIFIRLAVIFFIVRLIQILPSIVNSVFTSMSGVSDSIILKCLALVLLILGLLKFAQEAPELIKTMFNTGGNWMKGLNLKPGVKKHIEDNKLGMAGIGAGAGLVGGMIGGAGNAMRTAKERAGEGNGSWAKNFGAAAYGGIRGAVTGAVHGGKNAPTSLNKKDMGENFNAHVRAAQESYNKGTWAEKIIRAGQDKAAEGNGGRWKAMAQQTGTMIKDGLKDTFVKPIQDRQELFQGTTMSKEARIEKLGNLQAIIDKVQSFGANDSKLQAAEAALKQFNADSGALGKGVAVKASFDQSNVSFDASSGLYKADERLQAYLDTQDPSKHQGIMEALFKQQAKLNADIMAKTDASGHSPFKAELDALRQAYEKDVKEKKDAAYAPAEVSKTINSAMSSFLEEYKSCQHQLSADLTKAMDQKAKDFASSHNLKTATGKEITNIEQLAELMGTKGTTITPEMVDLMKDIKAEIKTANAAAILEEKKTAADPGKK